MSNILRAMSDGTPYNFIVKPHVSYDGSGVPVGGHGKVASNSEDGVAHVPLYTSNTHTLQLIGLSTHNNAINI